MNLRKRTVESTGSTNTTGTGNKHSASKPISSSGAINYFQQRSIVLSIVLASWVILAIYNDDSVFDVAQQLYTVLQFDKAYTPPFPFLRKPTFWLCIFTLGLPHILYFFIWTYSNHFYSMLKRFGEPHIVFASIANILKVFQLIAVILYFMIPDMASAQRVSHTPISTARNYFLRCNPYQILLGTQLLAFGQFLNYVVFKKLGLIGVYYGTRLKQKIPWVHTFPFDVVPHPQYIGGAMSIWGGCIWVSVIKSAVQSGIWGVALFMTAFYAFSAIVEQYL